MLTIGAGAGAGRVSLMLSLAQSFLPFCACSTLVKGSDDSWYGNALYGLNLAPRVLGLFGQRVSSRRDSGVLDAIFSENVGFTWHCYPLFQIISEHSPADQKARELWVRDCYGLKVKKNDQTRLCSLRVSRDFLFAFKLSKNACYGS